VVKSSIGWSFLRYSFKDVRTRIEIKIVEPAYVLKNRTSAGKSTCGATGVVCAYVRRYCCVGDSI
jgi:hypothetical protein